ncbi:MAG TPA: hypothetical protein VMM60_12450 [Ilumatobacter sp.]|nr:hypothetical protein [Ilumatobacter sp.]
MRKNERVTHAATGGEDRASGLDLYFALLAGDRVWFEGPTRPAPRDRIAASSAVGGAIGVFAVTWVALLNRPDFWQRNGLADRERFALVMALGASVALALLSVRYVRILLGRRVRPARFWPSVAARGCGILLIAVGFTVSVGHGQVLGSFLLGGMLGADSILTLWALGVTPKVGQWIWQFVSSPLHFGALGAMLATAIVADGASTRTQFGLYAALWTALGGVLVVIHVLDALGGHIDWEIATRETEVRRRERDHRAHWLHDDVLSEVQLASLRISSGRSSPEQVSAELLELDHRLRLRQLDEMMRGGTPPIYEVVQPHLRRAQNLGVRLDRVPQHDVTRLELHENDARMMERVLSILFSNAMNAGATRLSIDMELVDANRIIEVSVTDDAGGFELDDVPDGRGLRRLMNDLGTGNLARQAAPGGSTLTARIVLTTDRRRRRRTQKEASHA